LIADTRGAFAQPALYEAFGLTVVEAMTCGCVAKGVEGVVGVARLGGGGG
jgi:glycosyltransferase involved in cell wall biosynthesis